MAKNFDYILLLAKEVPGSNACTNTAIWQKLCRQHILRLQPIVLAKPWNGL